MVLVLAWVQLRIDLELTELLADCWLPAGEVEPPGICELAVPAPGDAIAALGVHALQVPHSILCLFIRGMRTMLRWFYEIHRHGPSGSRETQEAHDWAPWYWDQQ